MLLTLMVKVRLLGLRTNQVSGWFALLGISCVPTISTMMRKFLLIFLAESLKASFAVAVFSEMIKFHSIVNEVKYGKGTSVFSERTDDSSAIQYFQVFLQTSSFHFFHFLDAIHYLLYHVGFHAT